MTSSRYLTSDEEVVLEVRRHVAVLLGPAIVAAAVVIAAGTIGWVVSPSSGAGWLDTALGVVAVAWAARLGWRMWQWWVNRIVITDRRIFEVSGILTRQVASMPLTRVTDLTYRRSLVGRVLGYGDLVVESAGQDQALARIERLPRPDELYRTLTSLVTAAPARAVDPGPWGTGSDEASGTDEDDTGPLPRIVV